MVLSRLYSLTVAGICAISVCLSCGAPEPEYRSDGKGNLFVIREENGKKLWGLTSQPTEDSLYRIIPCRYDSIFSLYKNPFQIYGLFIAVRDGKKEVWTNRGDCLIAGTDFSDYCEISLKSDYEYFEMRGDPLVRFSTPQGYIYIRQDDPYYDAFGPYEYLYPGYRAYVYKKDGKWGVMRYEFKNSKMLFHPFLPNLYDAVYEVCINEGLHSFWLVKKDGRWQAVDKNGRTEDYPAARIAQFMRLPAISQGAMGYGLDYLYRRCGNDQVGVVFVSLTKGTEQEHRLWYP